MSQTETDEKARAELETAVAEVKVADSTWAVAELIRKYEDFRVRNAMADALAADHENGRETWAQACQILDTEADMDDAIAKLTGAIDDAISAVASGRGRFEDLVRLYHVEYAEGDGSDIGHHLAAAGRSLTAARALHRQASR